MTALAVSDTHMQAPTHPLTYNDIFKGGHNVFVAVNLIATHIIRGSELLM